MSGINVAFLLAAVITFTYLGSAVLVLFVEAPLGQMEKLLLG